MSKLKGEGFLGGFLRPSFSFGFSRRHAFRISYKVKLKTMLPISSMEQPI
jgi:hypothetical protein